VVTGGGGTGTATFDVNPGAATQLVLTTQAAGVVSGQAFVTQPVLEVRDANGNVVTTDNTTQVTMAVDGGASTVGTAMVTVVNGVATFVDVGILGSTGSYTLTFSTVPVLTPATQSIAIP
jgi:hypothetical protein